jgi:hypothetical protein
LVSALCAAVFGGLAAADDPAKSDSSSSTNKATQSDLFYEVLDKYRAAKDKEYWSNWALKRNPRYEAAIAAHNAKKNTYSRTNSSSSDRHVESKRSNWRDSYPKQNRRSRTDVTNYDDDTSSRSSRSSRRGSDGPPTIEDDEDTTWTSNQNLSGSTTRSNDTGTTWTETENLNGDTVLRSNTGSTWTETQTLSGSRQYKGSNGELWNERELLGGGTKRVRVR